MPFPTLIAHRGGAAEAPENTLAAFRHSLELGIRWFELDVQVTRDGALVVVHDETVNRTTNGSGAVGALTFDEIRGLDAGTWFDPRFAGEKVPTLREMLELCAGAGAGVLIEMKSPHLYPGIEQKVASLLGELWTRGVDNFWCISFDPACLTRLRAIDAQIVLGRLFELDVPDFTAGGEALGLVCPHYLLAAHHPDQVAAVHDLAKQVIVWTVNTLEDMRRMVEIGVDGIMSDHPSLLLALQGESDR